jgi:endonuclease/exonuclease/phosphatase family metal-dependent hydrolase
MKIIRKFLQFMIGAVVVSYMLALIAHLILRLVVTSGQAWWVALTNNFTPFYFFPLLITIPLALLARLNRRLILLPLLILSVIGLAWIVPRYIPDNWLAPPPAHAAGTYLEVVTFNMRGRSKNFYPGAEITWLDTHDELDIAFIQEIPRNYYDAAETLSDQFPYQINHSAETRLRGQSTLTHFTILETEDFTLVDDEPPQQRHVLEIDGRKIAVYNIHLLLPVTDAPHLPVTIDQNSTIGLWLRYDESQRNQQIRNLIDRLDAEELPYIVAGDFNTSDNAIIYRELAAHMTDAFRAGGVGLGASWPIAETISLPDFVPPIMRIDYIWHSDHFRAVRSWQGERVSEYGDHLPLFATLELIPE